MTAATADNWPEGVPRDYNELGRDFGDYITKRVKGYNKVGRNLDDLVQHTWLKLIESRVLEKFVKRANSTMASTMLAEEACGFLGITFEQWETMLRDGHTDEEMWAPTPLAGEPYTPTALFATAEILIIDEIDPWDERPNPKELPKVTAKGFRSYLSTAIHNHFANFCRTERRKNREQLLPPSMVLAKQSDGAWHQAIEIQDYTSWESTLVGEAFNDDEMASAVDFRDQLKDAFDKEKGLDWDSLLSTNRSGRATVASQRGLEVLDFIAQGYTIREAVKAQCRAQVRARARQRVRASVG